MICEYLNNKLRYRDSLYHTYADVILISDDTAYLDIIITEKKYRNMGNGRKLLEFIINDLIKKGITLLKLEVHPASTQPGLNVNQLHDWYSRFGFVSGNNSFMWLDLTEYSI